MQRLLLATLSQALPIEQLGIAPEHLEAGADLVDAVVQSLQLGRLVDYVLRAGDLAAVMQPRRDPELIAFQCVHVELRVRPTVCGNDTVHEHFRQHRHTLAVAPGIGAFGIGGISEQLDDAIEQALLGLDQLACLYGHCGRPGQLLDKLAKCRCNAAECSCAGPSCNTNSPRRCPLRSFSATAMVGVWPGIACSTALFS